MRARLTWTDTEAVGHALHEAHPEENPLDVEDRELEALVRALEDYDPASAEAVDEERLEAIRMEWYSHYSAASC